MNGMPGHGHMPPGSDTFVSTPIRPFRFLKPCFLPHKVRRAFVAMFSIYRMMESSPDVLLPQDGIASTDEVLVSYKKVLIL